MTDVEPQPHDVVRVLRRAAGRILNSDGLHGKPGVFDPMSETLLRKARGFLDLADLVESQNQLPDFMIEEAHKVLGTQRKRG